MHVQPGRAAAAKQDGRWPRSQPSYPELKRLEVSWGMGFWETRRNCALVLLRVLPVWLDSATELRALQEALPAHAAQHSHRKVG